MKTEARSGAVLLVSRSPPDSGVSWVSSWRRLDVARGDQIRDESAQSTDGALGETLLEASAEVAAGGPAGAEKRTERPVGRDRAAMCGLEIWYLEGALGIASAPRRRQVSAVVGVVFLEGGGGPGERGAQR
jgi:hypothetical protein